MLIKSKGDGNVKNTALFRPSFSYSLGLWRSELWCTYIPDRVAGKLWGIGQNRGIKSNAPSPKNIGRKC